MLSVKKTVCVLTVVLFAMSAGLVWAQQGPGGGGGGPGGPDGPGGPGGPPDPDQMRQMMMDHVQREMGASDDEFQSLAPKIEQLIQLQRDANVRPMRPGRGGPGGPDGQRGPGGPDGQGGSGGQDGQGPGGGGQGDGMDGPPRPPASAVQSAADDLHKTLSDKNATVQDIQTKVDALRKARIKAKADLAAAQDALAKQLTPKQTAALVELGLLD
jgi:hypothetical protein